MHTSSTAAATGRQRPSTHATIRDAVSVVICSYSERRWGVLTCAVESVRRQETGAFEIIVVVDHNPQLLEQARRRWPEIRVIPSRGQTGLGGARNTGIDSATGEIVAFLDDDAVAEPAWLGYLVRAYRDPAVIAVGGAISPSWANERPRWFPPEFDWVVGCTYRGMPHTTTVVRNLIGANMSFRRDALATVGRFRDDLGRKPPPAAPVGCDETEFCIRAGTLLPGRRILYVPEARVSHHVTDARAAWRYFLSRCYAEGQSKALVARVAGSGDALATERSYVVAVLPRGVARGLADAVVRRDIGGLGRAVAITAGLGTTTLGFVLGRIRSLGHPRHRPGVNPA